MDQCGSAQKVRHAMSNEAEYRRNAAETVQLAHRAPSVADQSRLLALAEAWLDLADRASRRIRRPVNVHPLVREKLDPYTEPNTDQLGGRTSD
jgi:hypothetical protein